jgi:hypothetical protein
MKRGGHRYVLAALGTIAMYGTQEPVKAIKEGVDEKDLPPGKTLTETDRDGVKRPTEADRDGPAWALHARARVRVLLI